MDKPQPRSMLTNPMQYILRVFAVAVTILVNAKWYREEYPKKRNIYLILFIIELVYLDII